MVELVPEGSELWEFLEVLRPDPLKIVNSFSNSEVSQGKVAESPLLLTNELVDLLDLGLDLLIINLVLVLLELVAHAQLHDGGLDIVDDSDDVVDEGSILRVFAEQFGVFAPGDNIPTDGIRFSQLDISINQVGEVGEGQAQAVLVLAEPLLRALVHLTGEVGAGVGQQKSRNLTSSANGPIAKSYVIHHFKNKIYIDPDTTAFIARDIASRNFFPASKICNFLSFLLASQFLEKVAAHLTGLFDF